MKYVALALRPTLRNYWLYIYGFTVAFLLLTSIVAQAAFEGADVTPTVNGGAIVGKVKGGKECANTPNEMFVSKGDILLYQAEVTLGSSFEFHNIPGKYSVVVIGKGGCFSESNVNVELNKVTNISMQLTKPYSPTTSRGLATDKKVEKKENKNE